MAIIHLVFLAQILYTTYATSFKHFFAIVSIKGFLLGSLLTGFSKVEINSLEILN